MYRDRQTHRQTHRQADRQTDRQTEKNAVSQHDKYEICHT